MKGTQLEKETTVGYADRMHRLLGSPPSTDADVYVLLLGHPQGSSNFDELPLRGSVLESVIKSRTRGILAVMTCKELTSLDAFVIRKIKTNFINKKSPKNHSPSRKTPWKTSHFFGQKRS